LRNSKSAKESLENITIQDEDKLVSFDVKSLFTSVPLDLALKCVDEIITANPDLLIEQTKLSKEEILELVKLCLEAAVFEWRG